MKAEEFIEKESACIYNTNEPIIPKSKALESVIMARREEKERAYNVLESVLDKWLDVTNARCILEEFKEESDGKK